MKTGSFECQGHILGSRRVLTNQTPHILTQDPHPMKRDLPSPEIPDLNPDPSLHTDAPLAGILGPDPGLDHIQEDTKGQEADHITEIAIQGHGQGAITGGQDTQGVEAVENLQTTGITTAERAAVVDIEAAVDRQDIPGDGEERKRPLCPTDADILEIEITQSQQSVWGYLV